MLPALIFGVALVVGLVLVARWWVQAEPRQLWVALRWTGLIVGVGVLAAIVLSGQWRWLPALLFPLIPWIMRFRALNTMRRNAQGPRAGQKSGVETRFLRMTLDHDTGAMDGEVVSGSFAGQHLSAMSRDDLIALWRECERDDEQSRRVLESYLDREHDGWRAAAGAGPREEETGRSPRQSLDAQRDVGGRGPRDSRRCARRGRGRDRAGLPAHDEDRAPRSRRLRLDGSQGEPGARDAVAPLVPVLARPRGPVAQDARHLGGSSL